MKTQVVVDCVIVPLAIFAMVVYHLWLLLQFRKNSKRPVICINATKHRRFWFRAMTEEISKSLVLAVQRSRRNIMISILIACTAIMISSIIAVCATLRGGDGGGDSSITPVFGDKSDLGVYKKIFGTLVIFLVVFSLNILSIRYHRRSSIVANFPYPEIMETREAPNKRGWSLGRRAFYFSLFPLYLGMFGSSPMLLCVIARVCLLCFLDSTMNGGLKDLTTNSEDDEYSDDEDENYSYND